MQINRVWCMPSRNTFTIKPIKELIGRYFDTDDTWIDPFAGNNSPAQYTNDLNPNTEAILHKDALLYLKGFNNNAADGIFFDPPYSITQARQCYDNIGFSLLEVKPSSMKYWKEVKDNMARILKPYGIAICCGWSSMGLGLARNFKMVEILLVPHGGSKNDTIITVEIKNERG